MCFPSLAVVALHQFREEYVVGNGALLGGETHDDDDGQGDEDDEEEKTFMGCPDDAKIMGDDKPMGERPDSIGMRPVACTPTRNGPE